QPRHGARTGRARSPSTPGNHLHTARRLPDFRWLPCHAMPCHALPRRRPAPLPYMTEQERTKHYSMSASASPETMPSGDEVSHLRRVLKPRHLTMIAIGGAIGTGLFVASGATIAQAGPGGALLTYLIIGAMVYFIMTSLGELAAFMPVPGSFATYASRYVDKGFGFALGWNFWFSWAVVVAVDLVASQLIMAYWFPDVPGIVWTVLFMFVMVGLNAISARSYGEAESWFARTTLMAARCS